MKKSRQDEGTLSEPRRLLDETRPKKINKYVTTDLNFTSQTPSGTLGLHCSHSYSGTYCAPGPSSDRPTFTLDDDYQRPVPQAEYNCQNLRIRSFCVLFPSLVPLEFRCIAFSHGITTTFPPVLQSSPWRPFWFLLSCQESRCSLRLGGLAGLDLWFC